jgi:hypothetical protein
MAHHVKTPGLLVAQRDRRAVDAHLDGIPTERAAQKRELGPFDKTEHHQPLDGRIFGLDRFDAGAITGLEIGKCQTRAPWVARK